MNKNTCRAGTREWSDVSHNIGKGCSHNCRYCYAAAYALSTGKIKTRDEWANEILAPRPLPTKPGVIMFPTAHDITPYYLEASISAIQQMMDAGRSVVIVTKAHFACVKAICDKFTNYKDRLILRVTIGSTDEETCSFWEPEAPPPSERLAALKYAYDLGYNTSVSMEPILIGVKDAVMTYEAVAPYVRELVWIGRMNSPDRRVDVSGLSIRFWVGETMKYQSDAEMLKLYDLLKDHDKVAWKDSIRRVVGI